MPAIFEVDDQGLRIFGYNRGIRFYDPDRELQQEIYLQDDDTLNIGFAAPPGEGDGEVVVGIQTLIAGAGLGGGGSSSTVTVYANVGEGIQLEGDDIALDIDGLTAQASPTIDADYVPIWDAGESEHRKVRLDNLVGAFGMDDLEDTDLADPDADRIVFWDDSDGQFEFLTANTGLSISGNNLNVDQEQIEDWVGAMVSGNTETHITVTYQDSDGTIDFVVSLGMNDLEDTDLADPNADRIVFWDDSDGQFEFLTANTGLSISGNNLNCTVTDWTQEELQDLVGVMVSGNTETHITVTYQDGDGTIDFVVSLGMNDLEDTDLADPDADRIVFWDDSDGQFEFLTANTGLSISGNDLNVDQEQIEDWVGAMVSGNTETHITVTYQDGDGTIDFVVSLGMNDLEDTDLADPNADRIVFWNDSVGQFEFLVPNDHLNIVGNNLNVDESSIDHGSIAGLGDDDHTQYFFLAGETTDAELYSGADLIGYSDAGGTETIRLDTSAGQIFSTAGIAIRAYRTSDLTVNDATWTDIPFTVEEFDTDTMHSVGSNQERFYAKKAGKYYMALKARCEAASGAYWVLGIYYNGGVATGTQITNNYGALSTDFGFSTSCIYDMAADDYVVPAAYQTGASANLNLVGGQNFLVFEMFRIA